MNTHVVTRPLPAGREVLAPGTEVDASAWRNARLLVEQRYLKPLANSGPSAKPGPEAPPGRRGHRQDVGSTPNA